MKILITGGAGYIGSHTIIEMMELTDWEIVSIDNYSNSSPDTYGRIRKLTGKGVLHQEVDMKDLDSLKKIFREHRFDGVVHFAALKAVGESVKKPLEYYQNNVGGLLNLIECQKEFEVPFLLFSSSCTVYGIPSSLPVTESFPIGKTESPYGFTKVIGERILEDISTQGEIKTLALRYFNPVGAHRSGQLGELPLGVPNNLVPFITQTAAGHRDKLTIFGNDYPTNDGTCIRDYIHVSDIARAHVLGLRYLLEGKQRDQFDYINLGTGIGVSVQEIVDAFIKVNGVELNYDIGPRRSGDVDAIFADNSKAQSTLGWQAELSLEDMVRSAWDWQVHLDS